VDATGDIILDAGGADVTLKDGGTTFGSLKQASGHLLIQPTSSKEIILNDEGGSAALTVETDGDVTVDAGNLVIGTAGQGIDFSAQTVSALTGVTPDTSAGAEVLDHYETGSWSPVLADHVSSGNELSAGTAAGYYTRIGGTVCITGRFYCSGLNSAEGDLILRGLPFTLKNAVGADAALTIAYGGGMAMTEGETVVLNVQKGMTVAYAMDWSAEAGQGFFQCAQFSDSGSITFSGQYII